MKFHVALVFALCLAGATRGQVSDVRESLRHVDDAWYDEDTDSLRVPDVNRQLERERKDDAKEPRDRSDEEREGRARNRRGSSDGGVLDNWPRYAILVMLAIVLVVIAVRAFTAKSWRKAAAPDVVEVARVAVLPAEIAADGLDVEAALADALKRGDWARAVVLGYGVILLQLDGKGFIRLERSTTNRAYSRQARRRGLDDSMHAGFEDVMVLFERVCFGKAEAIAVDAERVQSEVTRFRTLRERKKSE